MFIKGYTQDYYSDANLHSARIIFGKVISEDSSDIIFNKRSEYYADSTGYFEIKEKYEPGEIIIAAIGYLVTYYDLSVLPDGKNKGIMP